MVLFLGCLLFRLVLSLGSYLPRQVLSLGSYLYLPSFVLSLGSPVSSAHYPVWSFTWAVNYQDFLFFGLSSVLCLLPILVRSLGLFPMLAGPFFGLLLIQTGPFFGLFPTQTGPFFGLLPTQTGPFFGAVPYPDRSFLWGCSLPRQVLLYWRIITGGPWALLPDTMPCRGVVFPFLNICHRNIPAQLPPARPPPLLPPPPHPPSEGGDFSHLEK